MSFFDNCYFNFNDAIRLITMELKFHLVPKSSIPHHYVLIHPHKPSQTARFPNLFFSGTCNGLRANDAIVDRYTIYGSGHMGDDGVVRWRFTSIADGRSMCSSEGLQIGNVGSAAGIIGSWTGATYDHGDPASGCTANDD